MLTWLLVATSSRTQSPQTYSTSVFLPWLIQNHYTVPRSTLRSSVFCLTVGVYVLLILLQHFYHWLSVSITVTQGISCVYFPISVGSHYQIGLSRSIQPNPCWQFYELFGESLCLMSKTLLLCLPLCSDKSVKRFSESP